MKRKIQVYKSEWEIKQDDLIIEFYKDKIILDVSESLDLILKILNELKLNSKSYLKDKSKEELANCLFKIDKIQSKAYHLKMGT